VPVSTRPYAPRAVGAHGDAGEAVLARSAVAVVGAQGLPAPAVRGDGDVHVAVVPPGLDREDEAVARVAEARLERASHDAGPDVGGHVRGAVDEDVRLAFARRRATQGCMERSERGAVGILDGDLHAQHGVAPLVHRDACRDERGQAVGRRAGAAPGLALRVVGLGLMTGLGPTGGLALGIHLRGRRLDRAPARVRERTGEAGDGRQGHCTRAHPSEDG
jgi:hypothetical protein